MSFTAQDDQELRMLVGSTAVPDWFEITRRMSRPFTVRQCRERWNNYLQPTVRLDSWSVEEDLELMRAFLRLGRKWTELARIFPGRTTVAVRNRVFLLLRRHGIQAPDLPLPVEEEPTPPPGPPARSPRLSGPAFELSWGVLSSEPFRLLRGPSPTEFDPLKSFDLKGP
jgi:hypothetical protein